MKKEKIEQPLNSPDLAKKLESSKFVYRGFESAVSSGEATTYEWFEDNVIQKRASAEIGRDEAGEETATIKMFSQTTGRKEDVYYTTDEGEIKRLKLILEGKPVEVYISKSDRVEK